MPPPLRAISAYERPFILSTNSCSRLAAYTRWVWLSQKEGITVPPSASITTVPFASLSSVAYAAMASQHTEPRASFLVPKPVMMPSVTSSHASLMDGSTAISAPHLLRSLSVLSPASVPMFFTSSFISSGIVLSVRYMDTSVHR